MKLLPLITLARIAKMENFLQLSSSLKGQDLAKKNVFDIDQRGKNREPTIKSARVR